MRTSLFQRLFLDDKTGRPVLFGLIAAIIIIPFCNTVFPPESFFHISTFYVSILGKFLCYALLALALDLVWGYCGILSLGHGAFFSLGGYAMGMYLMRQIGDRGVYGNPDLPDFMVFLNWPELPWYWYGFDSFGFAFFMVLFVPGLLAFIFGWLAFRSRVTGVYLSIITQALTYVLMRAFYLNDFGFGGNNGFTDFKDILGFDIQSDTTRVVLFMASGLALLLGYCICKYVTTSKTGRVLVSIRDAESRTRFMGYKVEYYKLFVFTLSAVLAGMAGALFVPQAGIINPDQFSPIFSIEVVIWVALGGRGILYGAIIGALVTNFAKTFYTGAIPEGWPLVLGGIFLIATIYQNKGTIIGVIASTFTVSIFAPLVAMIDFTFFWEALNQEKCENLTLVTIALATIFLLTKYFSAYEVYLNLAWQKVLSLVSDKFPSAKAKSAGDAS